MRLTERGKEVRTFIGMALVGGFFGAVIGIAYILQYG